MKRPGSIARETVRNIGIFSVAALLVIFAGLYAVVTKVVVANEQDRVKQIEEIVLLSVEDAMNTSSLNLQDPAFASAFEEEAAALCDRYDIDYIFIYTPDFENQTMTYLLAAGNDSTGNLIPEGYGSSAVSADYSEDTEKLWAGELEYEIWTQKDKYGYELGTATLLTDREGNRAILGLDDSIDNLMRQINHVFNLCALVVLLVFGLIFIYMYVFLKRRILVPVRKISEAMNGYVTGDRLTEVPLKDSECEEFRMIADSFHRMSGDIQRYISHVTALTEERERTEQELQIAEKIQVGLLPAPQYDTPQFGIRTMMKAAKYVAGDLCDYFPVDDDHILLVIADVSGKGVTASMFMAVTLTLIRQLARIGKKPAEILNLVNRGISENNPDLMFVTAFAVLYDRSTNTLTYANAGHNLPYVLRDRELIVLNGSKGVPLGVMDEAKYTEAELQLQPGDILYMYTDGVTEAVNEHAEFLTDHRLQVILQRFADAEQKDLIPYVYDSLQQFCGSAEQADDITMLTLKINPTDSPVV